MRARNILASAAVAAFAFASLAGCTQADAPPASDPGSDERQTLPIATIMPLTGPAAVYGETVVDLLEVLVERTNAGDGVTVAGTTYDIDLRVYDDALDPAQALTVAREAIDDGAKVIFGPFGSASVSGVQSLMVEESVVWQIPIASVAGPELNPTVFKTSPGIAVYEEAQLRWVEENDDIQRVAMLTDQMFVGLVQSTESTIATLEGLGAEVVANQDYTSGDTDFRAPLTQILAADPDVLFSRGYTTESVLMTEQLRELGSDIPVIWNGGASNSDIEKLVTDESIMENVFQSVPLSGFDIFIVAGNPVAIELYDILGVTGAADAYTHDGFQILLRVLELSEGLEPEQIMATVDKITVSDLDGVDLLNDFNPFAGDLLFQNHAASIAGSFIEWVPGTGWAPVAE